ncbi:MAG: transcription elongation factor GreB [Pseudomonadota bacterium]
MSRYRPPVAKSSPYITAPGIAKLRAELEHLWRVERPQVTQAVSEAAAQGDRSENAEYIYGKKRLREIDRRIRFLQKRLDDLVVVDRAPADVDRIFFGAWVDLEDDTGVLHRYRIVGADEIDTARGWISIDAPMARALLKKGVDDAVEVISPQGIRRYVIIDIRYSV